MTSTSLTDNEYIEYVLSTYSNMIYRLAISITRDKFHSEDIMQEVFIRLMRKRPKFESKEHEKSWLLKVTINCSKKLVHSAWARHTTSLEEDLKFESQEISDVYNVVLKLPERYRKVIHLFYYEDLPIKQISDILNTSEGTIKSQLSRARDILKQRMGGGEWDYEYR